MLWPGPEGRKKEFERNCRQAELPLAPSVNHAETIALIERRALMGKGLSYDDVQLLASAAIADDVQLQTNDKKVLAAADAMGLVYRG